MAWATYADHLNNQTYMVRKPTYYMPVPHMNDTASVTLQNKNIDKGLSSVAVPSTVTITGPENWVPMFNPNEDDLSISRVTISDMSDMYHQQIEFVVLEDDDILDIDSIIYKYLDWVDKYRTVNTNITSYIDKMKNLHVEIRQLATVIYGKRKIKDPYASELNNILGVFGI